MFYMDHHELALRHEALSYFKMYLSKIDYEESQMKRFIQDELVLHIWQNLLSLEDDLILKSQMDLLKNCVEIVQNSPDPNFNIFKELNVLIPTGFFDNIFNIKLPIRF